MFKKPAIILFAICSPSSSIAQVNFPNLPIIAPIFTQTGNYYHNNLTSEQNIALFGEAAIPPGLYKIRNLGNNNCLVINTNQPLDNGLLSTSYIGADCNDRTSSIGITFQFRDYFAILPHPYGGYTIRYGNFQPNPDERQIETGHYATCLNPAKFADGKTRFTSTPCKFEYGATLYNQIGNKEQRYKFVTLNPNTYNIKSHDGKCLGADDRNRIGKYSFQTCDNSRGQQFDLLFSQQIMNGFARDGVIGLGYGPDNNGRLIRSLPVQGISFTGDAYKNFETQDDEGRACRVECVNDDKCLTYSWNHSDSAIAPICTLRAQVTPSITGKNIIAGFVLKPKKICNAQNIRDCNISN
ncbi:MAG: hypothetical protein J0L55_16975 [Caulobacterales bacterium]|nr:hypothetical protein [Caulobacterales bacterium]